jgi:ABC-2 type transport system ATP-binding protein
MDILEVKNLTKKFGSFTAVNKISFSLKKGEILGLLGPNGAGKTTTIQMLLGLTTQTSGKIAYFGKNFHEYRQESLSRINFTSAFNTLQNRTSVLQNLLVFANLYQVKNPKKKIMELVEYFEIMHLLNNRLKDLSTGQKTRINFIKSLLNDPELILMDEPTASLDPDIADKTLTLIEKLRKNRQVAILYTSHDMREVSRICDRVIFLNHGKIAAVDTPLNLTKKIESTTLRLTYDSDKNILEKYLKENDYEYLFEDNNVVLVKTKEKYVPKVIFGITNHDIWITDIEIQKPTLEDVFLQISRE